MGDLVICVAAVLLPAAFGLSLWAVARTRRVPPVLRIVIGNILVLGVLVSLVFLAGETYYRFLYGRPDPLGLSRVSERWFKQYFKGNRLGFRDDIEYDFERPAHRRRVSFLGDSFTAGHGIDDPEKRLANIIRRRMGWDVHLLAQAGFDTPIEIQVLQDLAGAGYQFDTVVLMYCLNDIAPLTDAYLRMVARIEEVKKSTGFLIRHSYFLNTLYCRIRARTDPDLRGYYEYVRAAYDSPAFEEEKKLLIGMRNFLGARGARFLVVIFPFFQELGPRYSYQSAHDRLNAFFRSSGIPCLDLLGVYRDMDPADLMVSGIDAHPNERANELAVEPVIRFITHELAR